MKKIFLNLVYAAKYPRLRKWINNPPTQEYVLPMLFNVKPSLLLWLKRKFVNKDLVLYSQYFHPSGLIENTMRQNFMYYQSRTVAMANPPPWFDIKAKKSEIYSCSLIIAALLESQQSGKVYNKDYEKNFKDMLEYSAELLRKKYRRENPELIPIMEKEKEYFMKTAVLSRDERRALEAIRKQRLHARIEELKNTGMISKESNAFNESLNYNKDCYSFYKMLDHYAKYQQNSGDFMKIIEKLGLKDIEINEKSTMTPLEIFNMRFDELYDISMLDKMDEEITIQKVTANL